MAPFLQHPLLTLLAALVVPVALGIAFVVRRVTRPTRHRLHGMPRTEALAWGLAFGLALAWAVLGVALASPPLDHPAPLESEIVR